VWCASAVQCCTCWCAVRGCAWRVCVLCMGVCTCGCCVCTCGCVLHACVCCMRFFLLNFNKQLKILINTHLQDSE
jgi:hypothetical protein